MDPSHEAGDRLAAFGNQLIEVHLWLREELTRLREDTDACLDGRAERPRGLRAHCLTFCSAVTRHHTGEDDRAFPLVADEFPELRPVLDELRRDHDIVGGMLRRLEELLAGLGTDPEADRAGAEAVRGELDGLAALLESHFTYEEKRLFAALNALNVPAWTAERPDFLRSGRPTDRAADGRGG